jgi:glycosyltransferase involved in cell wall biosynthesis
MQKRSILFLSNAYPDFDSSYRGIFIKKLAQLLQQDGYEISVVTPKIYKGSHYFEKQNGLRIYRFPFFAGNKLLIQYEKIPYLRMILFYITGFFLTIFAVLKHRCRLIHAHWAIPTGVIGALVGVLLRRPLIVTIHGSDFRMAMDSSFLLRKLFLYVCRRARHITCVSEIQRKEIAQLGIEGAKISVFPMGIDESFLEAGRSRERDLKHRPLTILSNRNLLPIYNVSLLIRAIPVVIKEEPKARFIIAGEGPERENIEKEAEDLNISSSVQFLGRVPHEKMPNILAQTDIYVSTSLYDGTSISLLEAMGSGAFPIVTDIPANREWIVNGENGFLVPTDEEGVLANRIIDAIRNQALLEKSRKNNLFTIEEKAVWRVNIKKVEEVYTGFLSSKN